MGVGFPLLAVIFAFSDPFVKDPIVEFVDALICEGMEIDPQFLGLEIVADYEDVCVVVGAEEVEEGGGGAVLKELGGGMRVNGGDSGSCGG